MYICTYAKQVISFKNIMIQQTFLYCSMIFTFFSSFRVLQYYSDTVFDRRNQRSSSIWNNTEWNPRRDVCSEFRITIISIKRKKNCAIPFSMVPLCENRMRARARSIFTANFTSACKNSVNAMRIVQKFINCTLRLEREKLLNERRK